MCGFEREVECRCGYRHSIFICHTCLVRIEARIREGVVREYERRIRDGETRKRF